MGKFIATSLKEMLLLSRDRSGLLVLFAMPAILVVVFTLIQNNILKSSEALDIEVLWVDGDRQALSAEIARRLSAGGNLTLIRELDGEPLDIPRARKAVAAGHYPAAVLLPAGLSATTARRIELQIQAAISGAPAGTRSAQPIPRITLLFDPLAQGALRGAVTQALNNTVLTLEMERKARALAAVLPSADTALISQRLLAVDARRMPPAGLAQLPTAVEQNVPAWALFGMFFIVVPLSGALIRERELGTLLRLRSLPVSPAILLAGKVCAYVTVAGLQFVLILLIGKYLLPALGTPPLAMGGCPLALAVTVLSAALAAAGYGILLSTLVDSYEQASMFGSVSVVIAAAVGGIMVPVYVMPAAMQALSGYSPLAWGLEALIHIFVRGDSLVPVLPQVGGLLAFSAVCMLLAGVVFKVRGSQG